MQDKLEGYAPAFSKPKPSQFGPVQVWLGPRAQAHVESWYGRCIAMANHRKPDAETYAQNMFDKFLLGGKLDPDVMVLDSDNKEPDRRLHPSRPKLLAELHYEIHYVDEAEAKKPSHAIDFKAFYADEAKVKKHDLPTEVWDDGDEFEPVGTLPVIGDMASYPASIFGGPFRVERLNCEGDHSIFGYDSSNTECTASPECFSLPVLGGTHGKRIYGARVLKREYPESDFEPVGTYPIINRDRVRVVTPTDKEYHGLEFTIKSVEQVHPNLKGHYKYRPEETHGPEAFDDRDFDRGLVRVLKREPCKIEGWETVHDGSAVASADLYEPYSAQVKPGDVIMREGHEFAGIVAEIREHIGRPCMFYSDHEHDEVSALQPGQYGGSRILKRKPGSVIVANLYEGTKWLGGRSGLLEPIGDKLLRVSANVPEERLGEGLGPRWIDEAKCFHSPFYNIVLERGEKTAAGAHLHFSLDKEANIDGAWDAGDGVQIYITPTVVFQRDVIRGGDWGRTTVGRKYWRDEIAKRDGMKRFGPEYAEGLKQQLERLTIYAERPRSIIEYEPRGTAPRAGDLAVWPNGHFCPYDGYRVARIHATGYDTQKPHRPTGKAFAGQGGHVLAEFDLESFDLPDDDEHAARVVKRPLKI